MENSKKKSSSWAVIILILIFIWPVGIFLLYRKLAYDDEKLKNIRNTLWSGAIFCYLLAFCGLSANTGSTFDSLDVALIIIFIMIAIVCTIFALKTNKKYKYYEKYVEILKIRKRIDLSELSRKMGITEEQVIDDIAKLNKYKMSNTYINEDNEIIIVSNNYVDNTAFKEPKKQITIVKCKNCGATNKCIEGKENRCEYCGTIIER